MYFSKKENKYLLKKKKKHSERVPKFRGTGNLKHLNRNQLDMK